MVYGVCVCMPNALEAPQAAVRHMIQHPTHTTHLDGEVARVALLPVGALQAEAHAHRVRGRDGLGVPDLAVEALQPAVQVVWPVVGRQLVHLSTPREERPTRPNGWCTSQKPRAFQGLSPRTHTYLALQRKLRVGDAVGDPAHRRPVVRVLVEQPVHRVPIQRHFLQRPVAIGRPHRKEGGAVAGACDVRWMGRG